MDRLNLDRLLQEQDKGLENCFQKIEKWEKFKNDYEVLQSRLYTLPDELSYDVMVPFGPMAMMPGKLIHTNEIFVLLGEDYFVERSAKQAAEIAGRRIKQCETMLNDLFKEKEQLQNWRKYTGEIQGDDLVEIIEEYDPVKEKAWREKHKKNVQAYHKKLAKEMQLAERNASNSDMLIPTKEKYLTEPEIQERLAYLETIEEKNCDDDECDESSESSEYSRSDDEDETKRKGIKWKDQTYTKNNTITFTHTEVVTSGEESSQEDELDTGQLTSKPVPIIQSPSDIYKQFVNNIKQRDLPKSILKASSQQTTDEARVLFIDNESTPIVNDPNIYPLPKYWLPSTEKKGNDFQGSTCLEKPKPAFGDIVQEKSSEMKTTNQPSSSTRRISKFRVQRMSGKM